MLRLSQSLDGKWGLQSHLTISRSLGPTRIISDCNVSSRALHFINHVHYVGDGRFCPRASKHHPAIFGYVEEIYVAFFGYRIASVTLMTQQHYSWSSVLAWHQDRRSYCFTIPYSERGWPHSARGKPMLLLWSSVYAIRLGQTGHRKNFIFYDNTTPVSFHCIPANFLLRKLIFLLIFFFQFFKILYFHKLEKYYCIFIYTLWCVNIYHSFDYNFVLLF